MRYLFSRAGIQALEKFVCEDTLFAFDFDGTLAPIVEKHDRAALPAPTARLLKKLSKLVPVALLSGRGRKDLISRVPFPLLVFVGNHGMEGVPGDKSRAGSEKIVADWARSLKSSVANVEGAALEDKSYSITLHYREAKSTAAARRALLKAAHALKPAPDILPGKRVLNLLTPGHSNKGTALKAIMKSHGFKKALFVGDDDTDEDVFRLRDPRIFTVRVGLKRSSSALTYLKDQNEADALLSMIVKYLESRRG